MSKRQKKVLNNAVRLELLKLGERRLLFLLFFCGHVLSKIGIYAGNLNYVKLVWDGPWPAHQV